MVVQSQASRIKWNSLFALLSQFIRLVTSFLLFVGIARLYGLDAFGQFTTAHAFATIFLLFADFGFDMLLPTELARHRNNHTTFVQCFFSLKVVFAIIATIGMMAVAVIHDFSATTRVLVFIFSFYVLFASLNTFFFAMFKGFEQFQHETRISFFNNLALLVLLVVFGFLGAPLYLIALCFVGTRILGIVSSLRIASQLSNIQTWKLNFSGWREVWRPVAVFGFQYVFGNLFFQLDTLLLAFFRGDKDVGLYQSVFKISTLALIVPDIAVTTMMPVLSRFHVENKEKWELFGRLLQKTLFLVSLPVSMILFVYADQIIELVYGATAFVESVPVLQVFAIIIFVRFGVDAYALMLTTSRRQSKRMGIVFIGTLLSLVLNIFVIPRYGIFGVAIVSLITNVTVGVGYIVISKMPFVQWSLQWRSFVPLLFLSLVGWIAWINKSLSIFITIPLVIIVSASIVFIIGYTEDERRLIFNFRRTIALQNKLNSQSYES